MQKAIRVGEKQQRYRRKQNRRSGEREFHKKTRDRDENKSVRPVVPQDFSPVNATRASAARINPLINAPGMVMLNAVFIFVIWRWALRSVNASS
ncbi:MAG: hypothetical protein KGQ89_10655 [Verrucomicrobia bacterium]|nr:hypothetical protein [Verrucomicrobiota bacterium]